MQSLVVILLRCSHYARLAKQRFRGTCVPQRLFCIPGILATVLRLMHIKRIVKAEIRTYLQANKEIHLRNLVKTPTHKWPGCMSK